MSKYTISKALLVLAVSAFSVTPSFAESFEGDSLENSSQVDITHGMAEQNAMHAMRTINPQGYVAGQVSMNMPVQSQNMNMAPAQFQQNQYAQAQPMQSQVAQNQFAQNQFPQNQMAQNQMAQNQCMQNNQNNNFGQCNQQQFPTSSCNSGPQMPSGMGMGVTKQMVGVLGTALIWNYMQNGGLNNFRPRGFGGPFNSFGPR